MCGLSPTTSEDHYSSDVVYDETERAKKKEWEFTRKPDTTGGYDLYCVLHWKFYSLYTSLSHVRRSSLYWCCILWESCNYCLLQFFLYVFCMYTLHTLEDLASSGDTVDIMRWMKGRITLWGSAGLWWFVVTWCSSGTHVVLRALAAQASGPRFDFQHISYLTSYIKHGHVLAYFCLSCFYETTFLGIIWQMMQTQHWNVSSCLCEIVCFETERA